MKKPCSTYRNGRLRPYPSDNRPKYKIVGVEDGVIRTADVLAIPLERVTGIYINGKKYKIVGVEKRVVRSSSELPIALEREKVIYINGQSYKIVKEEEGVVRTADAIAIPLERVSGIIIKRKAEKSIHARIAKHRSLSNQRNNYLEYIPPTSELQPPGKK